MANLKEIRIRLASVRSTRQITSAMKMVSASKLRRAQDAIIQMRPYALKMEEIISHLLEGEDAEYAGEYQNIRDVKKVLIVSLSSNKGLCGAFNSNIAKTTMSLIDENYMHLKKDQSIDIYGLGKKGTELLRIKGYPVAEAFHELFDPLSFEVVAPLAEKITNSFLTGVYDEVKIIYNQFKNAAIQRITVEQYLPILLSYPEKPEVHTHADHILEPSRESIVRELVPKMLKIQLYKAMLDSVASEHGARMTAMHKATDNATDMIRDLQLEYNKARQATITKEILEIVGGAEALKG